MIQYADSMARTNIKNGIVERYGKLWSKTKENLKQLSSKELRDATGVYALYNGTMPVYIGEGNFCKRIQKHASSPKRSPFWEHFSWFEISDKARAKEIESVLLRVLPFYLRSLNKKGGDFASGEKTKPRSNKPIKNLWPKGGAAKKRHRKTTLK